ncbi:caspase domain-containing protein [Amycolatopsis sp. lyj-109]|uniref:caspase family protein n=1 Tax=Amycolatopsis sp. lyj-109 TaxID=2789287 RepID=UPI0039780109
MTDAAGPRAGLPDPRASRAVLVGVSDYTSLEALPAVANNIETLHRVFTDPDLWGLPNEHCVTLLNPGTVDDVLEAVHAAASEASDALVFYFAGHGLLDDRSDLYLALPGAAGDRLYRSVRYDDIRREIVGTARACYGKVAILDCCYSGRALQGGMGGSAELADHARVDGTYLMTASAETSLALAPPDEPYTAFTGALVDKLVHGLPEGPDLLDMETLFYHVRVDLQARHFPVPQQRTRNDGKAIALVRNRHRVGVRPARERASDPARELPQPPPGMEALLRRRPADMYLEVQAMRAHGQEQLGEQLLAASAALRADQEVAAIAALLWRQGNAEDVRVVLAGAALRAPAEVLRVVNALHDMDIPDVAIQLVRTVGACRAADAADLASLLQADGRDDELVELLNAAFGATQAARGLIDLINALWLAGLREEVDRLILRAASDLPGADIVALADELREVGREEVAFGLYAAAADIVATRPPPAVAQLCKAMTEAGHDAESTEVAQGLVRRAHDASSLLDVADVFWETEQEAHADLVVARAAEVSSIPEVIAFAAGARLRNHEQAAYRICSLVAASRPAGSVLEIVASLREEGRPVDARKVLRDSAARTTVMGLLELLAGSDDADRGRILEVTVDRGAEFCAALLAALGPAHPDLARRFADLVTKTIAAHPELIVIIVDALDPATKERMFASLAEGVDPLGLTGLLRDLPSDEAKTLMFLAVRAGRPALGEVFAALASDGSALPAPLTGQPVNRLGALVRGLRPEFPAHADALLADVAAPGRGEAAIAHDIAYLFGTGEADVGRAVLHTALTGRSNDELKLIVAALRDRNQPDSLAETADWVRTTYAWMGADGILRQLGLREFTGRKSRPLRRIE